MGAEIRGTGELDSIHPELESLLRKRDFTRAATLARKCLDLAETTSERDPSDVAQHLHKAADLSSVHRMYAQAEPLYRRALAIRESLGSETTAVRATLSALGT